MSTRVLAGQVVAVDGNVVTIELWDDPDTGESIRIEVPLTPSPGLDSVAYASVTPDGALALGEPYAATGRGVWAYGGTNATADPGAGRLAINGSGNSPRTFAVNKTDADGFVRNLLVVSPGDNLTITDDPETPPITGFARYVVTGVVEDLGAYVRFTANRTDTAGTTNPPPIDTRLRVSFSTGGSGSGGPLVVRFDTYNDLLNGITIGG